MTFTCAIFNPQSRPPAELPVIYGFNNGGTAGILHAVALAEDGTVLGGHGCSHEAYMPGDLGVIEGQRLYRHQNDYQPHYPGGYRMEWVPSNQIKQHAGLQKAIQLANTGNPEEKADQHE